MFPNTLKVHQKLEWKLLYINKILIHFQVMKEFWRVLEVIQILMFNMLVLYQNLQKKVNILFSAKSWTITSTIWHLQTRKWHRRIYLQWTLSNWGKWRFLDQTFKIVKFKNYRVVIVVAFNNKLLMHVIVQIQDFQSPEILILNGVILKMQQNSNAM